jgi:hypothetical protein
MKSGDAVVPSELSAAFLKTRLWILLSKFMVIFKMKNEKYFL